MDVQIACLDKYSRKMTKRVKFCLECDERKSCKLFDKTFEGKSYLPSTSFHQMNDISTYVSAWSNEMIVDLDCPNSVIGRKDEKNFYRNLSKYQRENLLVVSAEETLSLDQVDHFDARKNSDFP